MKETQKGLIPIKKIIVGLIIALLTACIVTQASAATKEELTEQVSACQQIKDKAHEMAECARFLGFDEDHVIIQTAKAKWMEAYTEELNLQEQIAEMESGVYVPPTTWTGAVLNARVGTIEGPSGKETYYNLPMQGCVNRMRRLGYDEVRYPVWTRDDGAKMFGPFVMCAASLQIRPLGTIVESSRGFCIVVDTGSFARSNPYQLDLCFAW